MLKYAESVSVGTPSPAPRRIELTADVHPELRLHDPRIRGSPQMKALEKRSPKVGFLLVNLYVRYKFNCHCMRKTFFCVHLWSNYLYLANSSLSHYTGTNI